MHKLANMSWPRVLVGGVVIVSAIFLALEMDSRWQDRKVGFEEQQVLQGLEQEFTSVHEVLTHHLAEHSRTLDSLEILLLEIDNGPSKGVGPI